MRADVRERVRIQGGILASLYAAHSHDALRLAYLLTGDRGLAEDLVQDAFVRLAGRLLHLRNRDGFRAYLHTTIVNLARSHYRRRRLERRYEVQRIPQQSVDPPDLSDREEMRRALLTLPIRQRTAVVLRYYEDLSEAQTADLMRVRRAAVRSLVSRGMETLRKTIGEG